jgi:hypothetical protein
MLAIRQFGELPGTATWTMLTVTEPRERPAKAKRRRVSLLTIRQAVARAAWELKRERIETAIEVPPPLVAVSCGTFSDGLAAKPQGLRIYRER